MNTRRVVLCCVAVAAAWLFPRPCHSQVIDSTFHSLKSSLVDAETADHLVRVYAVSDTITGRLRDLRSRTFRVGSRTVDYADVRTLEIRFSQPDPLLNGALIGAGVGATLLARLIIGFSGGIGDRRVPSSEKVGITIGSAVAGVFIGGAIDAALEKPSIWRAVYP